MINQGGRGMVDTGTRLSFFSEVFFSTIQLTNMKTIFKRMAAPTPPIFAKIRNIGLVLTAVAVALTSAPVALPAVVIKIAGYLALAGGVASAVSQVAVEE
jgi:hypothetical protein